MGSNYKPIGDYIQLVKEKNKDALITNLLGINIDKFFMPSVANIVGTDLSAYKIVREGQFACNRMHVGRDYRIPIAISRSKEPFIVSPAYSVFKIIDTSVLHPEYLMMWFSRKEFDRNAWFHTDADVRGGLPWELFCELELPIPPIEKQREIIKEYNTIVNRIALNEKLIQKLEETAQAIYKQWFVDFEFPNEDGKPYKSDGGKMVWCEELEKEIPEGWKVGYLGDVLDTINGYAFKSNDFNVIGEYPIIKIKNIKSPYVLIQEDTQFYNGNLSANLERVTVIKDDILISMTGSGSNQINSAVGQVGKYFNNTISLLNQRVCKLQPKKDFFSEFIFQYISSKEIQTELLNGSTGSANQANISPDQIKDLKTYVPAENILKVYSKIATSIDNFKNLEMRDKLVQLKELLLAKMTLVDNKI